MAAEKFLSRIANVTFGRQTTVTTFSRDSPVSNTFKLLLASQSDPEKNQSYVDMRTRVALRRYRQPRDNKTSSLAHFLKIKPTLNIYHNKEFHTRARLAAIKKETQTKNDGVFSFLCYLTILSLFVYFISIVNVLNKSKN